MVLQDHVGGVSLPDERGNQFIQPGELFGRNINTGPGLDQYGAVLTVGGSSPVIGLIQPTCALLIAGVADKGGLVEPVAMVGAWSKVLTVGVTVVTEPAHFLADRSVNPADVLLFAVFEKGTFVSWFIEMVVLVEGAMFFDLLGDGGRIFAQLSGNAAEGMFQL